jgi:TM2 domain-containing membrane protein YozV
MEKKYISALLSAIVFPGAGQFSNSQPVKGIVYILLTLCSVIALVCVFARSVWRALEYSGSAGGTMWDGIMRELGGCKVAITALILILGISWAASVVDAYLTARKIEMRGIKRFIARKG